jgi:hypothetical protein
MTRLIARLILAMLLLPLTGTVFVMFMAAFASEGGPQTPWSVLGMWATVYAFVGVYWVLLWRAVVRWTRKRKLDTALAGVLALLLGGALGAYVHYAVRAPPEVGVLVGGGLVPIVWVLATVLIWRETPQERIERITAAGTDSVCCPVCGYNLTGLKEARCPECGSQFTLDQLLASHAQRDHAVPHRETA